MAFQRMIWKLTPVPITLDSWDYWTSVQKTIIEIRRREDDDVVDTIYKANKKIAYYSMVNCEDSYTLIIISPVADAVTYIESGVSKTYRGTITDVNGITWYWGGFQFLENSHDYYVYPDCVMGDTNYSVNDGAQAAQDLLDRIYAVPFHEDYQNTYYILNKTDVRKTLRKVYGLSLAFLASSYVYANVAYISDNADTIISDILTKVGNNTDTRIRIYSRYDNPSRGIYINVYYGTNSDVNAWVTTPKEKYRGLEYYSIGTASTNSDLYSIYVDNGIPTVTESSGGYTIPTMGVFTSSLYDLDITNLGIDL